MVEIAPSILSADFTRLGEQIATVESGGASLIHVDVMDGHFVPNITVGPFIVQAVRRATKLPIDAHLMIERPDDYISEFARAGANLISIHPEATYHLNRTLNHIRQSGCQAGLVLNPGTPLSWVEEVIDDLDYVLLMSVNPGFGGQKFIPSSLDKLRRLRALLDSFVERGGNRIRIEIDGGIGPENAAQVAAAGAEIFVAGSAVFGAPDPAEAVRELSRIGNSASRDAQSVRV
ncbi:MAG TPA: ribulose-phosphate 3-epimerase [Blastocatellia bacterium]|nr:ribulose-phosphate 3-epimerase [Blastocatellia bacterium]